MKSRPDIVVLNDYASTTGGSTAVAVASALGLVQAGHRVTYFSCVGPVAPALRDVPNLEVHCLGDAELIRHPQRWRAFFSGLHNRPAVRSLRAVLARHDPDETIVHAHTWTKALSPYALAAVTDAGFPLVVTLHDFSIVCPNGGFFVYPRNEVCRRRPLSASCLACSCDRRNIGHKAWRTVRTWLQNRHLRIPEQVAHYVAVSDFSAAVLRPHLPASVPLTVVSPPVPCVDQGPAAVGENSNFVYAGRLVPEKGVRLFAEAAASTGLPAVMIGEGELRGELTARFPRLRFTGWLDAAAMRRELRAARALVFPSHWYETLGLVAVEAAAAGVPVIVSRHCAAADVVRDGETGLHFDGSEESLTAAMRRLADDAPLATRLGDAAYRWYWENPWTVDRHVADLKKVYDRVSRAQPAEEPGHECVAGLGAR
ncbi:MAG TPA: glycosyltransferase family 4 protein [Candidatus Didemnitutus sp.]|nr:glycosyltransferase family 4 protein [Candidatus Didemnitutus sp.]